VPPVRVSFVIPTRNQAAFITKCIDSCFAQGIPDAEVIVVDGASTDGTQDVLRGYGDRIKWTSEKDGGQSDAINKGVRAATGEIIAWINSDDYYASPRALAPVLEVFDRDPDADIVYGDGTMVDVDGKAIRTYPSRDYTTLEDLVIIPSSFVLQPVLLFKRQLFLDVGGLDEKLHYTLDYELFLRMFPRARKVVHVRHDVAHAVYHHDAKSIRGMRKQIIEFMQVKHRYASKLSLSAVQRARLYTGMASLWAYYAATRLGIKRAT
jgi:glycosyltransferase involved in cell wall biosynthesis